MELGVEALVDAARRGVDVRILVGEFGAYGMAAPADRRSWAFRAWPSSSTAS